MLTKPTRVMVLTASTRPTAVGPAIARWFTDTVSVHAEESGVELVPVSLAELDLPFLDEEESWSGVYTRPHTLRWAGIVAGVDAIVAVTPEYNHSMPAALKNALDFLGPEWAWKPIGFVSYGNTSAGTRSVQHAKQVVTTLRLMPIGATVALRLADAVEDGRVRPDAVLDRAAHRLLDELTAVSRALEPVRRAAVSMPGPVPGTVLRELVADDAPELAVLSRASWADEAIENDSLEIPALHESLAEVAAGIADWRTWGLWSSARLIGTVRIRRTGEVGEIGRLAVVLDARGRGLGGWLLRHAEGALRDDGASTLELHTGGRSRRNIAMYTGHGYRLASAPDAPVAVLRKPVDG